MSPPRLRAVFAAAAATVFLLLGDVGAAWGQATGSVTGVVREAGSRRPLESAQVFIPGAGLGALTNSAGRFLILNVPAGQVTVRVELIGYGAQQQTATVAAGQAAVVGFDLRQTMIELDQLVVTGAGVATERRKLGNTIAAIDVSALQDSPVSTFSDILQGREPGVVGLPSGGITGEGSRIRIRGSASLSQSNEPVVYVDGIRVDNAGGFGRGVGAGGGGTPSRLDDINPESIERVEILKGAAAATLYGTQASSGVIQIFTKRGQSGAPRYDLRVEQGFSNYPVGQYDRHAGFVTCEVGPCERPAAGYGSDVGANGVRERWGLNVQPYEVFEVDMIKDLVETGYHQTYSLSVNGGTPAVTYFLSGRLQIEDGPFGAKDLTAPGLRPSEDKVERRQATGNIMIFPFPEVRVRVSGNYAESFQQVPNNNNNIYGVLSSMLNSRPEKAHANNLFGSPAFATTRENFHRLVEQDVQRFGGSVSANYQPTSAFSVDGTFGVDVVNQRGILHYPFGWNVDAFTGSNVAGIRTVSDRNHRELTLDVKATWDAAFGADWTSAFLVGGQGFITQNKVSGGTGNAFPAPGLEVAEAGALQTVFEEFLEEVNAGFFVQEQIGFRNFLFGTIGARYDEHSAFGETAGGQLYPKVSLSVVPSDLSGWQSDRVSTLRFRAALGQSGLQPGAFDKFTTFAPLAAETGPGLAPDNLGNEDLKPELSTEWELGAEVGLFQDRASLEVTYWNRTVSDVLVSRQFAPSGGFRLRQLDNIGEMTANGFEIGARANVYNAPNLSVNLFANASYLKEEITDLGGAPPLKTGGSYPRYRNFLREGHAPGAFFGPKVLDAEYPIRAGAGCEPSSRAELLEHFSVPRDPATINTLVVACGTGDVLNQFLGKPTPDWQGAFGGNIGLPGNLQLNTLFEYRFGNFFIHDLSGGFRRSHPLIGRNVRRTAEIEAILINPASTAEQRLEAARIWSTELMALSPLDGLNEIHEADWLRLRELSLTWTAPQSLSDRVSARSLAFTASGRNLALWTKYPGDDPELNVLSRPDNAASGSPTLDGNFLDGTAGWGWVLPRRFNFAVRVGF